MANNDLEGIKPVLFKMVRSCLWMLLLFAVEKTFCPGGTFSLPYTSTRYTSTAAYTSPTTKYYWPATQTYVPPTSSSTRVQLGSSVDSFDISSFDNEDFQPDDNSEPSVVVSDDSNLSGASDANDDSIFANPEPIKGAMTKVSTKDVAQFKRTEEQKKQQEEEIKKLKEEIKNEDDPKKRGRLVSDLKLAEKVDTVHDTLVDTAKTTVGTGVKGFAKRVANVFTSDQSDQLEKSSLSSKALSDGTTTTMQEGSEARLYGTNIDYATFNSLIKDANNIKDFMDDVATNILGKKNTEVFDESNRRMLTEMMSNQKQIMQLAQKFQADAQKMLSKISSGNSVLKIAEGEDFSLGGDFEGYVDQVAEIHSKLVSLYDKSISLNRDFSNQVATLLSEFTSVTLTMRTVVNDVLAMEDTQSALQDLVRKVKNLAQPLIGKRTNRTATGG